VNEYKGNLNIAENSNLSEPMHLVHCHEMKLKGAIKCTACGTKNASPLKHGGKSVYHLLRLAHSTNPRTVCALPTIVTVHTVDFRKRH
jgi:hypothetical protein